jgi:hypothetical protein
MRAEGIDGAMTVAGGLAAAVLNADIAMRFVCSSSPVATSFALAQLGFALAEFGRRLAWRYSTVNEGVVRFNGILKKSVTLTNPAAERSRTKTRVNRKDRRAP